MRASTICPCTHARLTHTCVICVCSDYRAESVTEMARAVMCYCGHAADTHRCRKCACREYWPAWLQKLTGFERRVGKIPGHYRYARTRPA